LEVNKIKEIFKLNIKLKLRVGLIIIYLTKADGKIK